MRRTLPFFLVTSRWLRVVTSTKSPGRGSQKSGRKADNRVSGSHKGHAFPIPDSKEKVLKTAVLYGANGAGKSNLFKALYYLKTIALNPRKKNSGTGRESFRFKAGVDEHSSFDLQFIAGNKLYRFGFKLDDQRIIEEWLVRVKGGNEAPVYERVSDENGKVTIEAKGLKGKNCKLLPPWEGLKINHS